ncbi:hypothetical protein BJ944DRAFT_270114 [Cunninghamella echinulata]|nr:hypothetical protein BJ944DRAFT_270114 [Cunninghamella echinulata]
MNTKPKMHVHFEEGDGYNNNNNNKTNDYDGQQQYVNNNYNDEQYTEYYNQDEQYTDDYNYNELDYYTDDYINNIDIPLNAYGAAFVTNVDSEINNNKKKKNSNYVRNGYQERQYPVDEAGPIIYAVNEEDGNDHNKKESSIITATDDDDDDNDINSLEIPKKKVDYDTCPKISMQSDNGPVAGEHIAIKTLDLSDTYTPEISDWKEVKVLEVNKNEITVLLIQQVKQSNKGKRKFDLPDEDNEDQVENNESQEDNILQYMSTDIFDMCRITI